MKLGSCQSNQLIHANVNNSRIRVPSSPKIHRTRTHPSSYPYPDPYPSIPIHTQIHTQTHLIPIPIPIPIPTLGNSSHQHNTTQPSLKAFHSKTFFHSSHPIPFHPIPSHPFPPPQATPPPPLPPIPIHPNFIPSSNISLLGVIILVSSRHP